jgi:hypothetical protein
VHGVTRRAYRPDQVRAGERRQQSARVSHCRAHQRGTVTGLDVGARMQAQQAERPRGFTIEMPVRPREHHAHRGPRIASAVEQVKSLVTVI